MPLMLLSVYVCILAPCTYWPYGSICFYYYCICFCLIFIVVHLLFCSIFWAVIVFFFVFYLKKQTNMMSAWPKPPHMSDIIINCICCSEMKPNRDVIPLGPRRDITFQPFIIVVSKVKETTNWDYSATAALFEKCLMWEYYWSVMVMARAPSSLPPTWAEKPCQWHTDGGRERWRGVAAEVFVNPARIFHLIFFFI